jgi:hypothetical protein
VYATIHQFAGPLGGSPDLRAIADVCLPAGSSPAGTIALGPGDAAGDPGTGTLVALWADEAGADATGSPVFSVSDRMQGRASGRRPLFAQVTWLNGDGGKVRADAAEHGGRHRIWPAVEDIDGIVEVLALRGRDHRVVVVALATAAETHEQVQRRVMATELLPDEDPALLPGADRVDLARVLAAEIPTGVRS